MSDKTFTWRPMPRYKLRKHLVKRLLAKEETDGKTCLEIGYGAGDMLRTFAEKGMRVDGFDFSPYAREHAEALLAKTPLLAERVTFLADEHEWRVKRYDYIFFFEVLEHIEDDRAYLESLKASLTESGRIVFSVPAHMSKWGANDSNTGHYRRYEKDALTQMLCDAGYTVDRFWNYPFPIHILLDHFLMKAARKKERELANEEHDERTKRSGVERKQNVLTAVLSSDVLLFPFSLLQNMFLEQDFASAYIVMAHI